MATIRPSRRIERAGVNAVRTLLEDHEHIVQEIDGGNDHGEDLFVNLTRSGKRTGHYFAAQVKSGKKYKRARGYAIPVDDHYDDWKQSRIPVLGIVYDPDTGMIFWTNLTKQLRAAEQPPSWVQIPLSSRLTSENMRGFAAEVEAYVDGAGMRVRGATQEEALTEAIRARKGIDPELAPNPLYEGFGDFALRHEDKIAQIARTLLQATPLMILALVMVFEWPYQVRFVERYSDISPVMWILNLYIFMFYMALTMFFEFRAGRVPKETGHWLALIAGNFLWIPIWDPGGHRGWWGTLWILLGATVPSWGYKTLLVHFIWYAKERRKRAQQAA
ncbi:DUF4365 domain-containing protein [Streptomyces sp. NBC_00335]|uniref:DUF4365 domain-containing protein n=1 Tax=unclassified Streptomyces TaxID=2593676 RepID=UPI002256201A|nr:MULTISPECIES: DUF4365 domain-containing protein [unclassified Streptomyces]MCX5406178.1 DUF4365 domain-containing protein [Streptomyces sp. NBC_00086]